MLRRYNDPYIQRFGYDFYADIAEKIVKGRKKKGITAEQLAKATGISLSKISRYESVQIRCRVSDLEKIAKALDVNFDWLICAEYDDENCGECVYLIGREDSFDKLALYFRATSPQMAFLKAYEWSCEKKFIWFEPRVRAKVKLVGVPVKKSDLACFRKKGPDEVDEIDRSTSLK